MLSVNLWSTRRLISERDLPNPETGQPSCPSRFLFGPSSRLHIVFFDLSVPLSPSVALHSQSIMADDDTSKSQLSSAKGLLRGTATPENKEGNLSGHVRPRELPHKYEVHALSIHQRMFN